jgi:chromosomal replication initiation ATPase DnaA
MCGFGAGQPGFVRADVPVSDPAWGRVIPCPVCHAKNMAAWKQFCSPLEGELAEKTFDNFYEKDNRPALEAAQAFAREPQGILVLCGPNGRGKSHLLAAIHNHLREYAMPAKYFSFPDWTSQLRSKIGEEVETPESFYQYVSQFPIVLIDDIEHADMRQWTREQVFRLFNRRYNCHREVGTVLAMETSPRRDGEMKWLLSRLNDERVVIVEMQGPDNRQQIGLIKRLLRAKDSLMGK